MNKNVGSADRMIRLAASGLLFSLIVLLEGPARWWGLLGIVPLATAAVGSCPLYPLLGINTCSRGRSSA